MRTSLYSILCIVIRMGALILAIETLVGLPSVLESTMYSSQLDPSYKGVLIGFYGAFFALAAVLWIYPGTLARLAAGQSSRQVFESPIGAEEWQYIAISVVGVYFAISGIGGLLGAGTRIIMTLHIAGETGVVRPTDFGRLIALAAEIVIGIALAFGARGLVGLLRTMRERGLPPVNSVLDETPDEPARPNV